MGLFSKKNKTDNFDDDFVLDRENTKDDFWDFKPLDKSNADRAGNHSLTADEIMGASDDTADQTVDGLNPAEKLLNRMVNNSAPKAETPSVPEKPAEKIPTVEELKVKEFIDSLARNTKVSADKKDDGAAKAEAEPSNKEKSAPDLSRTAEFNALINELKNDAKENIADKTVIAEPKVKEDANTDLEAKEEKQESKEPEYMPSSTERAAAREAGSKLLDEVLKEARKEKPQNSFDDGAFKRFFVSESGTSEIPKKPIYSLESVESILAEAEKNAVKNAENELDKFEEILLKADNETEFHYYADEHIPADTEKSPETESTDDIYVSLETKKSKKPKDSQKKSKKTTFKVDIKEDDPTEGSFEYNCLDDAAKIKNHLSNCSSGVGIRLFITIIIEIAILLLTYILGDAVKNHSLINFIGTILLCAVNLEYFTGFTGWINRKKINSLPIAFAMISALSFSVCDMFVSGNYPHLSLALGLILIFALIGQRNKYKRIFKNFKVIANNDQKYAVELIKDSNANRTMAGDSIDGDILLATGRKTTNINGFMKYSTQREPGAKIISVCTIISLIFALALFVYQYVKNSNIDSAFTAFTLVMMLSCPLSINLFGNLPLWLAAKKLNRSRSMLAGHLSADKLSNVNAVAVTAADILPPGSLQLCGIKPLHPNKLDETILYAATLIEAANNPLGPIFRKIANTNKVLKSPDFDSIKYESKMGISGWVNDSQLLIGNRTLMEAHSINIPSLETDKMILEKGFFPVYVARDGFACALLAINYIPDPEITYELRRLCNNGITVLINSNDPNITEEMVCDYFGLYSECVKVMNTDGAMAHKNSTNYQESTPAPACYYKSACGLLGAVNAAVKIKWLTSFMTALYAIVSLLGAVCIAVLTVTEGQITDSLLLTVLFQAIGLIISCLPAYISKP